MSSCQMLLIDGALEQSFSFVRAIKNGFKGLHRQDNIVNDLPPG